MRSSHSHRSDEAAAANWRRLFHQLDRMERYLIMADVSLDDILAETTAQATSDASIAALLTGIKTQLDQALSGATLTPAQQAKVNAIFGNLKANDKTIADAIAANTPAAPGGPTGGLGATSTAVTSSANPVVAGTAVTLTAVVTQSAPAAPPVPATGTVNFMDGTTSLGTGTLDATGTTTLSTTFAAPVGDHSITAVYAGDAANATSTSNALVQTVTAS